MNQPDLQNYHERIDFNGELEDLAEAVSKSYEIGQFQSCRLFEIGYEDFNFSLQTSLGKYFVKVFSEFRTLEDCRRYIDVMRRTVAAGVITPSLVKSSQGDLCQLDVNSKQLRLCVLEYIDGSDLYASSYSLNADDIRSLSSQAALIASIEIKPAFIYDSWAVVNFPREFAEKGEHLTGNERSAVKSLVEEFDRLDIRKLPHCFVHGDLISTNIVRDNAGKLWIVDFAASNYYPRIQELAVLACDLFFDPLDKGVTDNNLGIALDEYQRRVALTPGELAILPSYIKFAHAMHILRANYEKVANNNDSLENSYWLERGQIGLRQMGVLGEVRYHQSPR